MLATIRVTVKSRLFAGFCKPGGTPPRMAGEKAGELYLLPAAARQPKPVSKGALRHQFDATVGKISRHAVFLRALTVAAERSPVEIAAS
jgi:hypothetical protein